MSNADKFGNIAFGVSALLDPISQLLGLGSFNSNTDSIKNGIQELATKAYNIWKEKEQGVFGSGISSMASNMPNRDDLEKALYNDLANETYAMVKKAEEAHMKDTASGRNNPVLNLLGDAANTIVNTASNIGNALGIPGSDKIYNMVQKEQSKWANQELNKVYDEAKNLANSQSKRVADFNKQLAASHNQNRNQVRERYSKNGKQK